MSSEAKRRNQSITDFVSAQLYRVVDYAPLRCFFCGSVAMMEYTATLTDSYKDKESVIPHLAKHGEMPPEDYSPAVMIVSVCKAHETELADALLGMVDGVSGLPIVNAPSVCPHPFHSGSAPGDQVTEEADSGVIASITYRRCPECGESTYDARPSIESGVVDEMRRMLMPGEIN